MTRETTKTRANGAGAGDERAADEGDDLGDAAATPGPRVLGLGGTLRPGSTSLAALDRALEAAARAGARTRRLPLRELELPVFRPGRPPEAWGPSVRILLEEARAADALLISTAAYHGTVAGVVKNALDFLEYLADDPDPYLDGRSIGLIAVAGGQVAAVQALGALVHAGHALRATILPSSVVVHHSAEAIDAAGEVVDEELADRLDRLGRQVAGLAGPRAASRA